MSFDDLVTIFIDTRNKINYDFINFNLNNKLEKYNRNLELIIIYGEKNNDINKLLNELNVDIPITIIKNDTNLPSLVNIGLGNIKFLIDDVSITQLTDEFDHTIFIGRRANIYFN